MALRGVTVAGATTTNSLLFTQQQTQVVAGSLTTTINQSTSRHSSTHHVLDTPTVGASASGTADTVSAGRSSLTIQVSGPGALSAWGGTIDFHSAHANRGGFAFGQSAGTLSGAAGFGDAASGNQTLLGGVSQQLPSHHHEPHAGGSAIATVFGAATAGSPVVFDLRRHPQGPAHDAAATVGGAAPDLLVGWSVGQSGFTLDLGAAHGATGNGQPGEHTDIRMAELPREGTFDIVFHKPS